MLLQPSLIFVVYTCDKLYNRKWFLLIYFDRDTMEKNFRSTKELAVSITEAASRQTALTIRFLADRNLRDDAYRAYAYFRWVDDWVDQGSLPKDERLAFIDRQQALIHDLTGGFQRQDLTHEEQMLADLIQTDALNPERSGLRSYIDHMMAVMAFDAERRGRLISKSELNTYAFTLSAAVTEAMHYFIGHDRFSPSGETRYLAVAGAHITHMLRDTLDDNEAGYFNIPREYLKANHISPLDVGSKAYRDWVKGRVQLARSYFNAGREYMAQVECLRCRLAGFAYMARFETVLDLIESDDYLLRAHYPECKTMAAGLSMGWSTLQSALNERTPSGRSGAFSVR
jgi:phytoene/squalene synthetase